MGLIYCEAFIDYFYNKMKNASQILVNSVFAKVYVFIDNNELIIT